MKICSNFYEITPYSSNMDRAAGKVIPPQLGQWIGEANFFWQSKQYTDLQLGQKFPIQRSNTGSTTFSRGIKSKDFPHVEHISVVTCSSQFLFPVLRFVPASAWTPGMFFPRNVDKAGGTRSNHPGIHYKIRACNLGRRSPATIPSPELGVRLLQKGASGCSWHR